jgi:adenosylhomocysteine nucleosidase
MKEFPAIIAALPREIEGLVRSWGKHNLPDNIIVYTNDHAVVACAGMGAQRVALAVEAAMWLKPVTALVSVGLAGACDPSLKVGDIIRAGSVIDASTGERYTDSQYRQILVSTPTIASIQKKQALRRSYDASAVDMEAATVAGIASTHHLPFRAVKVISDDASFELEELSRFATQDGQFREAAFALYASLRPRLWKKLFHLAGNSKHALKVLTEELESQLDWYRQRG